MSRTSPFPGMDPWLEDHWGDVHASLTAYARDRLQQLLPLGLRASIEEYVAIESKEGGEPLLSRYIPDVSISARRPRSNEAASTGTAATLEVEPAVLPRLVEPPTQREIRILDTTSGNRIVTSIEFLSHANKTGRGWKQFRKKQTDFIDGGVNLVEIDLIRSGSWALSIEPDLIPAHLHSLYRALVVRGNNPWDCEYYPISIQATLPKIKIPLRSSDADVVLELQPLLDQAYINGRYADALNYSDTPFIPLPPNTAEWAAGWLKQHPAG